MLEDGPRVRATDLCIDSVPKGDVIVLSLERCFAGSLGVRFHTAATSTLAESEVPNLLNIVTGAYLPRAAISAQRSLAHDVEAESIEHVEVGFVFAAAGRQV